MHRLLQVFEPDAVLTDNIWGVLWAKLAYASMLFASALNNDGMAGNFGDPAREAVDNDDFIVFAESGQAVQDWKKDRSIPLAQVVDSFKVFVTHK